MLRARVRQQMGLQMQSHLVYGQVEDFPEFPEERIPCFAGSDLGTNTWGWGGRTESEEQQRIPYLIPATDAPAHGDLEPRELPPPNVVPWDYEPASQAGHNQTRRPALGYNELSTERLSEFENAIIADWFNAALAKSYHEQIKEIGISLRSLDPPSKYKAIAHVFGVSKGTIINHIRDIGWTGNRMGRPSWLSKEESDIIADFITERFTSLNPVSYCEISHFISCEFHLEMPIDTVRQHISSLAGFKIVQGRPMDTRRLECDPKEIDAYFDRLDRIFEQNMPSALVLNLDETGHDDWGDKKWRKVVVPVAYESEEIEVPVSRESKRATLLGAIAASGAYLRPLVIVPRLSVDTELFELGFTEDMVMYGSNESGFITTALFNKWIDAVLIPYVKETRLRLNYWGWGVLLLDGCSCHDSDYFLDQMTYWGIEPVFLPAHSSDQTQALDLGIFGLEKAEAMRTRISCDDLGPQTRQVARALVGYMKACVPINVIGAFRQAGIVSHFSKARGALVPTVNRQSAKRVRHWELSRTRIPIESLGNSTD